MSPAWTSQGCGVHFFALLLSLWAGVPPSGAEVVVAWGDNRGGQLNVPSEATNVVAIAAGRFHNLALAHDGRVLAWGSNNAGQVTVPSGLTNVIAVAAGDEHSLALHTDGTVAAWGANRSGQGTVPTNLTGVIAIAAGEAHSLALRSNGVVVGWGRNYHGQATPPPDASPAIAIAAGGDQSLVLRSDGMVVAWGHNGYTSSQLDRPLSNVLAIAAARTFAAALLKDGSIFAWGDPYRSGVRVTNVLGAVDNVVAIAAGGNQGLALFTDATVGSWGSTNQYVSQFNAPLPAPAGLSAVTAIAVGEAHALALTGNGTPRVTVQPRPSTAYVGTPGDFVVRVAGDAPLSCQWERDGTVLPDATNTTLVLPSVSLGDAGLYSAVLSNAAGTAVSSAARLTVVDALPRFAVQPVGRAVTRGLGVTFSAEVVGSEPLSYQWLKDGSPLLGANAPKVSWTNLTVADNGLYSLVASNHLGASNSVTALLEVVPILSWQSSYYGVGPLPFGLTNIIALESGYNQALALRADGRALRWTADGGGLVGIPGATNLVAVSSGFYHNLVLRADGQVLAGGSNVDYYGLYAGQSVVPTGLADVVAIAAGGWHSLALKRDGTLAAWGISHSETWIPPLTNVAAIASGTHHNAALLRDGTVFVWGSYKGASAPPAGLSNVIAVAAGWNHTLALKADGTVTAWGDPGYAYEWTPQAGISNVVAIGAMTTSTMLLSDGTVVGRNLPAFTNVALVAASGWPLVVAFAPETAPVPRHARQPLRAAGEFRVSVDTRRGRCYVLVATDSLATPNWRVVEARAGDGTTQLFTDPTADSTVRFYRIVSP